MCTFVGEQRHITAIVRVRLVVKFEYSMLSLAAIGRLFKNVLICHMDWIFHFFINFLFEINISDSFCMKRSRNSSAFQRKRKKSDSVI